MTSRKVKSRMKQHVDDIRQFNVNADLTDATALVQQLSPIRYKHRDGWRGHIEHSRSKNCVNILV